MSLGIVAVSFFLLLWLVTSRLALTRRNVLTRPTDRGLVLPGARELRVPQLVAGGDRLLSGVRRSAYWQAPGGARVSLN